MRLVFGLGAAKPVLIGLPWKVRVRRRADGLASAYVKDDEGIQEFRIEEHGDVWRLGELVGSNHSFVT